MKFTPTDTETYNTVKEDVLVSVSVEEIEMEMVYFKAGTFKMGSPTTETRRNAALEAQWDVTLSKGFYIGKYEVTQDQYEAVMENNPSKNNEDNLAEGETQGRRPVDNVCWFDTLVFCNKLSLLHGLDPAYVIFEQTDPEKWGEVPDSTHDNFAHWNLVKIVDGSNGYRLPTEAQWEYACRAGTPTPYNTGVSTPDSNIGWYLSNSGSKTHEVGLKYSNVLGILDLGFGLYDMHGNVSEWCWDWMGVYPTTAGTDPTGPDAMPTTGDYARSRVLRGGHFMDSPTPGGTNTPINFRSASRSYARPDLKEQAVGTPRPGMGFRVVRPEE